MKSEDARIIDFEKEQAIGQATDAFELYLRQLTVAEVEIFSKAFQHQREVSQTVPDTPDDWSIPYQGLIH